MAMTVGPKGLALIKSFESFVPHVYDDLRAPVRGQYREWDGSKPIGTLTIGYGHTNAAKHPLKISKGLRITEKQALEILDVDLDDCEASVNRLVKSPITQGQFDGILSFDFNCGSGNTRKLIEPLNRGDYAGTRAKFDQFIRSKGKVLRGLQRRRDAEQALWDDKAAKLPTGPVHHSAEVEYGKKTITKAVSGSKTLKSQLNALVAVVVGVLYSIWDGVMYAASWIGQGLGLLPAAATDVTTTVTSTKGLFEAISIPWPTVAGISLAAVGLTYAFIRGLGERQEGK